MSEYSHNPLISADSANHGNHQNGLTTRQNRALMALLDSPWIVAVTRKAEVGESTLRQYLLALLDCCGLSIRGARHLTWRTSPDVPCRHSWRHRFDALTHFASPRGEKSGL